MNPPIVFLLNFKKKKKKVWLTKEPLKNVILSFFESQRNPLKSTCFKVVRPPYLRKNLKKWFVHRTDRDTI